MSEAKFIKDVTNAMKATYDQGHCSIIARDYDSVCAYRGEGGLKCTIGHMIKDEFYDVNLESNCGDATVVKEALKLSLGYDVDCYAYTITTIQGYHDDCEGAEDFKARYSQILRQALHSLDVGDVYEYQNTKEANSLTHKILINFKEKYPEVMS